LLSFIILFHVIIINLLIYIAGVNALSEDGNLQFHQLVFRCGWATKNLHTAFDYIFNSELKDSICGKILSKWNQKNINGENIGGFPADVSDVISERDRLNQFVTNLYSHQDAFLKDTRIKNMLVGSIFLWEDDFVHILSSEDDPRKVNDGNIAQDHIFLHKIEKTKNECGKSFLLRTLTMYGFNYNFCISLMT